MFALIWVGSSPWRLSFGLDDGKVSDLLELHRTVPHTSGFTQSLPIPAAPWYQDSRLVHGGRSVGFILEPAIKIRIVQSCIGPVVSFQTTPHVLKTQRPSASAKRPADHHGSSRCQDLSICRLALSSLHPFPFWKSGEPHKAKDGSRSLGSSHVPVCYL